MSLQPNSGRIGAQLRDRARHSPSQSLRFWQDLPASRVRFTQLRADDPGTGDQLPPRRSQATCSSVFNTAGTAGTGGGTSAPSTGAASSGTGTAGGTATVAGAAAGRACPAAAATAAEAGAGAGKAVTEIGPPTIAPAAAATGADTGVSPPVCAPSFCHGSAIWQAASPVNNRMARTRRMASLRKTAAQARPERPVRCKWPDASVPIRTAPDAPGAAPRSPPAPRATASPLPPRYCCAADPSWWPR